MNVSLFFRVSGDRVIYASFVKKMNFVELIRASQIKGLTYHLGAWADFDYSLTLLGATLFLFGCLEHIYARPKREKLKGLKKFSIHTLSINWRVVPKNNDNFS